MLLLPFIGDSFNSSLVSVVSVDPDVMKAWAASQNIAVVYAFWLFKSYNSNPLAH